jgi:hydroxypyruvate reductase
MLRTDLVTIFKEGIRAVQPGTLIPLNISLNGNNLRVGNACYDTQAIEKIIVIGAGKASAAMALAVEGVLGEHIYSGLVITKYGHQLPLKKIGCRQAGHPLPDQNGVDAAREIKSMVKGLTKKDLVICLISGGASALMSDAPEDISLQDMQQLAAVLLKSGAAISEMNTIRKHLSSIKGGQLSKLVYPAKIISLILSDVIGDSLSVIASGPTVPDPTTYRDAYEILLNYNIVDIVPAKITGWLQRGMSGDIPDTPKPGDFIFNNTSNHLIGTNRLSIEAAKQRAEQLGYTTTVITYQLQGEASERAMEFTNRCLEYNGARPACLLMGGETTVTITGNGLGGRNQHFILSTVAALQMNTESLKNTPAILSGGTDGTDGPTDAAGAFVDAELLTVIKDSGLEVQDYLNNNDSYHFFDKVGGLIRTGPTQTNVMDLVIALID